MVPYVDRFADICQEMVALHTKKGADYGSQGDPYANVRASQEFGVPPWLGAIIRLNDKITRIKSFTRRGTLENESLFDSLRDIAVYGVIAQLLYQEENAAYVGDLYHDGGPPQDISGSPPQVILGGLSIEDFLNGFDVEAKPRPTRWELDIIDEDDAGRDMGPPELPLEGPGVGL